MWRETFLYEYVKIFQIRADGTNVELLLIFGIVHNNFMQWNESAGKVDIMLNDMQKQIFNIYGQTLKIRFNALKYLKSIFMLNFMLTYYRTCFDGSSE